jgi:REP element-mobilizing transposase RayT
MTYLITFACYGAHIHGEDAGSVDRKHHVFGDPVVEPDPKRRAAEERAMDQLPYTMDAPRRAVVLSALQQVCVSRGWALLAAHVRSNHVHVVVRTDVRPEKILNAFKSYASRALNEMSVDAVGRKRWARHGSTQWLWKHEQVSAAISYVVHEQGRQMAVMDSTAP